MSGFDRVGFTFNSANLPKNPFDSFVSTAQSWDTASSATRERVVNPATPQVTPSKFLYGPSLLAMIPNASAQKAAGYWNMAQSGAQVLSKMGVNFGAAGSLLGLPSVTSSAAPALISSVPELAAAGPAMAGPGAAAGGGAGASSALIGFLTNPITIGVAAAAIGIFIGIKLWKKRSKRKKAKKAAKKFNQIYQQKLTEYTKAGYTADQAKFMAARDARASLSPKEMELMQYYCAPKEQGGLGGGEQYVYDALNLAMGVDQFMQTHSQAQIDQLLAKPLQVTTGDVSAAIDKYNAAYQAALADPEIRAKSYNSQFLLQYNARQAAYNELSPAQLSAILGASRGGGNIPADLQQKAAAALSELKRTNFTLDSSNNGLPTVNIMAGDATPALASPAGSADVAEFVGDFNEMKAELKAQYAAHNLPDNTFTVIAYRTFDADDFATLQQGITSGDTGALQIRDDIIKAGTAYNVELIKADGTAGKDAPPAFFFKEEDIDASFATEPVKAVSDRTEILGVPATPAELLSERLQQRTFAALRKSDTQ